MRVFVTGAAGFIGSHLVERLLGAGHQVLGLDNFDPFYPKQYKLINWERCQKAQLIEGDIRDTDCLRKIYQDFKPERVFHLAARAGVRPSIADPLLYIDVNIQGTARLLEVHREHNASVPFIMASSSSVYGNNQKVPFAETDPVDTPVSPYAATKKSNELWCYNMHHLYKIPILMLRFFTVYGPGQRPEMAIHQFTRAIHRGHPITLFGDGTTLRDYTYIDDIIMGMMAMLKWESGFEIVNLGATDPVPLPRMVNAIAKALNKTPEIKWAPLPPGDVQQTYADVSKAAALLGFKPSTCIEEGVQKFVEWYVQNHSRFP